MVATWKMWLATLSIGLLAGCAQRPFRATPFHSSSETERARIHREVTMDRTNAWPVYFRGRTEEGLTQSILWPVAVWHRSPDDIDTAVFPLVAWRRSPERTLLVTPLGASRQEGESGWMDILGPLYFEKTDRTFRYQTILFPLFHKSRIHDSTNVGVIPLFWWSSDGSTRTFLSIPFSTHGNSSDGFTNVGLVLFHHGWDGRESSFMSLLLGGADREEKLTGAVRQSQWLFPLLYHRTDPDDGSKLLIALLGGREHKNTNNRTETWLFPLFYHRTSDDGAKFQSLPLLLFHETNDEASLRRNLAGSHTRPAGGESLEARSTSWLLGLVGDDRHIIASGETSATLQFRARTRDWAFPFYYHRHEENVGRKTEVLWRLYDSLTLAEPGQPASSRTRILFKLYSRVAEGDKIHGDAFPFLSWDRSPGFHRWRFAGGLLGYSHDDQKGGELKLFWTAL